MAFVMYRDAQNMWRWYLRAANNRKIADSGEGYHNKQDCRAMIDLIKTSVASAPVYEQ